MYLCVTFDFLWDVIIYGQDPLNTSVGSIVFSFFILTGKIIFQGSLPSHSVVKYFHLVYPKVASSNTPRLEAHAGFFRFKQSEKGVFRSLYTMTF